jgi:hypothetical protein
MSSSPFNATAIAVECDKLIEWSGSPGRLSAATIWFLVASSIAIAFLIFTLGYIAHFSQLNHQFIKVYNLQEAQSEEAMYKLFQVYMQVARGRHVESPRR